jgi:hypothetical protein
MIYWRKIESCASKSLIIHFSNASLRPQGARLPSNRKGCGYSLFNDFAGLTKAAFTL